MAFSLLLIQIIFQLLILIGLAMLPRIQLPKIADLPPISVVVAARNEANHLQACLTSLAELDYPTFEVIVVDDGSSDASFEVVQRFAAAHADQNVRAIRLNRAKGKKAALTAGIDAARFEHLAFTDADCVTANRMWLHRFGMAFSKGADVVIGTGLYRKGSWLQSLYSAYQLRIALMYHAAGGFGMHYMAVGRSMAYTRNAFRALQGFEDHAHIASGSDDLLVQAMSKQFNVQHATDAVTWSDAPQHVGEWIDQRKRHLSTAPRYPIGIAGLLMVFELSALSVPFAAIFLLVFRFEIAIYAVCLWGFRDVLNALNHHKIISLVNASALGRQVWMQEFPASWMNALISIAGICKKKRDWKTSK